MSYKIIDGRKIAYLVVRVEIDADVDGNEQEIIAECGHAIYHRNIKNTKIVDIHDALPVARHTW